MKTYTVLLISAALLMTSCKNSSIDGRAQEEHRSGNDSRNTNTPANSEDSSSGGSNNVKADSVAAHN